MPRQQPSLGAGCGQRRAKRLPAEWAAVVVLLLLLLLLLLSIAVVMVAEVSNSAACS